MNREQVEAIVGEPVRRRFRLTNTGPREIDVMPFGVLASSEVLEVVGNAVTVHQLLKTARIAKVLTVDDLGVYEEPK
jgi:hypothetical protein